MNKILKFLVSTMLLALLSTGVFADTYTPSVTAKPVPPLVPVTLLNGQSFLNNDVINQRNYPVTVIVADKNNSNYFWGYATDADDTWHAIVVTPVSRKDDNQVVDDHGTSEKIKDTLKNAYENINLTGNLDMLTTNKKAVTEYITANGINATVNDFVVRDLFDITIYGPDAQNLHDRLLENKNVTFTFKLNVKADDVVIGMHQPEDTSYLTEKGMTAGDWEVIPTTNNGDGTVTITLTNLSPVLFAIKVGSSTPGGNNGGNNTQPSGGHSRNTGDNFNKGMYIGAMIVAAGGIVLLAKKKKEDK